MPTTKLTVSKTVIIALIVVTTVVLTGFGSAGFIFERRDRNTKLHDDMTIVVEQLAQSLALPLWNFEDDQAAKIVESALRNREVHAVLVRAADVPHTVASRVRDVHGVTIAAEPAPDAEGLVSEQRDIVYAGKRLGSVEVFFTTQYVRESLHRFLIAAALTILVLNAVLVSILYAILNNRVLRPLKSVEQYALQVSAGEAVAGISSHNYAEELENLRSSIENMVLELQHRYQDLERSRSDLAAAEARYRNIFENALNGIFQTTPEGRFLTANPAMARILGYESPQTLVATVTDAANQVYEDPGTRHELLSALAQHGEVKGFLFRFRRADGTSRWGELHAKTIRDAAGKVLHLEGMIEDVTDRKQTADELATLNRHLEDIVAERTADLDRKAKELEAANFRLRELDAAKSAFLSSVSHELRTPMTSVLGFTKLIFRDFTRHFLPLAEGDASLEKKGARIRENLHIIEHEGERLTTLINDVLDLAKIESGRVEWHDVVFQPELLISRAVGALGGQFSQNANLSLTVKLAADLPPVKADIDRLEQVLINLLSNAAKFTASGTVTVEALPAATGGLEVRVADSGVGVPEYELESIFNKFHQVIQSDVLGDKPRGTGLGLTICRQIIEHYGGRIWATSKIGEGSVFTFVLPALALAQEATPISATARHEPEFKPGRQLILVVDDDPAVQSYLCQLLEREGYNVVLAADGAAALKAARRFRPDLMTMDIMMPGMDGNMAITLLRRDSELSNIPILVVSVLDGYAAEAADVALTKPIDEEKLLDAVHSLLGQARLKQPVILLLPFGSGEESSIASLCADNIESCDQKGMWARIEAGFQGTVVLPAWAVPELNIHRLLSWSGIRVLILPEAAKTPETGLNRS